MAEWEFSAKLVQELLGRQEGVSWFSPFEHAWCLRPIYFRIMMGSSEEPWKNVEAVLKRLDEAKVKFKNEN